MKKALLEKAVVDFKRGNEAAFNNIYDLSYKLVFFVALDIVRDKQVAEDIVQDTFIKVYNDIDKYDSNNFTAWIARIAKNLSINEYNKRKRENTYEDLDMVQDISDGKDAFENLDLFNIARKVLSEDEYKIVIMCVISGFKRREVSKILDIPISTVSFKLKTALKKIEEELKGGKNEY